MDVLEMQILIHCHVEKDYPQRDPKTELEFKSLLEKGLIPNKFPHRFQNYP